MDYKSQNHNIKYILMRAILLFVIILFYLTYISQFPGIHIDEGVYAVSAFKTGKWILNTLTSENFEEFKYFISPSTIKKYFHDLGGKNMFDASQMDVHPILTKIIIYFGYVFSPDFLLPVQKIRFGNCLVFSLFGILFYNFAKKKFGEWTAILSLLFLLTIPHIIGYSAIALTDGAVMILNFLCITSFIKKTDMVSDFFLKLFYITLMFAAKINIIITLAAIAIIIIFDKNKIRNSIILFLLTILGSILFICVTPQFWDDPVLKYFRYFYYHIFKHAAFEMNFFDYHIPSFFSKNIWWFPIIFLLYTFPLGYTFYMVKAFKFAGKQFFENRTLRIIFIGAIIPMIFCCMPNAVKISSNRLILPCIPFICILMGFYIDKNHADIKIKRLYIPLIIIILTFFQLIFFRYNLLMFKNELSNFIIKDYKYFQIQGELCEINSKVINYINELPENSSVGIEPFIPLTFSFMKNLGIIKSSIRYGDNISSLDYIVVSKSFRPRNIFEFWEDHYEKKIFSVCGQNTVKIFQVNKNALQSKKFFFRAEKKIDSSFKIFIWISNFIFLILICAALLKFRKQRA